VAGLLKPEMKVEIEVTARRHTGSPPGFDFNATIEANRGP
jgi:hypothetical protein